MPLQDLKGILKSFLNTMLDMRTAKEIMVPWVHFGNPSMLKQRVRNTMAAMQRDQATEAARRTSMRGDSNKYKDSMRVVMCLYQEKISTSV